MGHQSHLFFPFKHKIGVVLKTKEELSTLFFLCFCPLVSYFFLALSNIRILWLCFISVFNFWTSQYLGWYVCYYHCSEPSFIFFRFQDLDSDHTLFFFLKYNMSLTYPVESLIRTQELCMLAMFQELWRCYGFFSWVLQIYFYQKLLTEDLHCLKAVD